MRSEKAVTLITLTITIIVLIILTFTITINMDQLGNQNKKSDFETDVKSLKEEVDQYYAQNKKLPIINKFTDTSMLDEVKNVNDNDNYYVIDINKLDVTLNYGTDYNIIKEKERTEEITDLLDVYIINEQSHTIYYPKGIEYDGKINYTLKEIFQDVQAGELIEILKNNAIVMKENKEIKDRMGNTIVVPEGFKIAEDSGLTVEEGIVIEDSDVIEGIGENKRKPICMDTSRTKNKKE